MDAEDLPTASPRSRGRRIAVLLAKWGLIAAALYLSWRLVAGIRWSDVAARVEEADPLLLGGAVALLVLRFALWDQRFRLAAHRALGSAPHALLGFFVLLASAALNLITPSARLIGGMMRARYFARAADRSFGLLYGIVFYDQMAHHITMTVLTWLAVVAVAFALGHTALAIAALAALVLSTAAFLLWSRRPGTFAENPLVRFLARRAAGPEGRIQRLWAHGHEAAGIFVKLLADAPLRAPALALGVLWFLANGLAQWVVFAALGQPVDVLLVLAVVALGNAAGILTGTPGGVGTTEAAMVATFAALGMDRVEAGAGTLLYRGLHYIVVLALGLPALGWLELRGRAKAERQPAGPDTPEEETP
jgi:uncharacterized membrane protein YbhN (UPF0104 family)